MKTFMSWTGIVVRSHVSSTQGLLITHQSPSQITQVTHLRSPPEEKKNNNKKKNKKKEKKNEA